MNIAILKEIWQTCQHNYLAYYFFNEVDKWATKLLIR